MAGDSEDGQGYSFRRQIDFFEKYQIMLEHTDTDPSVVYATKTPSEEYLREHFQGKEVCLLSEEEFRLAEEKLRECLFRGRRRSEKNTEGDIILSRFHFMFGYASNYLEEDSDFGRRINITGCNAEGLVKLITLFGSPLDKVLKEPKRVLSDEGKHSMKYIPKGEEHNAEDYVLDEDAFGEIAKKIYSSGRRHRTEENRHYVEFLEGYAILNEPNEQGIGRSITLMINPGKSIKELSDFIKREDITEVSIEETKKRKEEDFKDTKELPVEPLVQEAPAKEELSKDSRVTPSDLEAQKKGLPR